MTTTREPVPPLTAYERQRLQTGAAWLYRTRIKDPPEAASSIAREEGIADSDVTDCIEDARAIFARLPQRGPASRWEP